MIFFLNIFGIWGIWEFEFESLMNVNLDLGFVGWQIKRESISQTAIVFFGF